MPELPPVTTAVLSVQSIVMVGFLLCCEVRTCDGSTDTCRSRRLTFGNHRLYSIRVHRRMQIFSTFRPGRALIADSAVFINRPLILRKFLITNMGGNVDNDASIKSI